MIANKNNMIHHTVNYALNMSKNKIYCETMASMPITSMGNAKIEESVKKRFELKQYLSLFGITFTKVERDIIL